MRRSFSQLTRPVLLAGLTAMAVGAALTATDVAAASPSLSPKSIDNLHSVPAAASDPPSGTTWQFPGSYPFIVPSTGHFLLVTASGARGGNATSFEAHTGSDGAGGLGDIYQSVVSVAPDEPLSIVVGSHPGDYYPPPGGGPGGTTDGQNHPLPAGGGRGGDGGPASTSPPGADGTGGAGGGGASGVFTTVGGLNPVLLAGGGGGGGGPDNNCGCGSAGAGGQGGPAGSPKAAGGSAVSSDPPVAGGGIPDASGTLVGALGQAGTSSGDGGGGGGGGGWNGGGGGQAIGSSSSVVNQPGAGGAGGTSMADSTQVRPETLADLGSSASNDGSVTAQVIQPAGPANLVAQPNADETSVAVTWDQVLPLIVNLPRGAGYESVQARVISYTLAVSSPDGGGGTGDRTLNNGTSNDTVTGLTPGKTYNFSVGTTYEYAAVSYPLSFPYTETDLGPYAGPTSTVTSQRSTTTAVTSSADPAQEGKPITFTATVVSPDGYPLSHGADGTLPGRDGTVQFLSDGAPLQADGQPSQSCNVPAVLTAGSFKAACTTSLLATGSTHVITAVYSGSRSYTASQATLPGGQNVVTATAPTLLQANPPATANAAQPYRYTFTAGGSPAPAWSATNLPSWLTLDPVTGLLSGTAPGTNTEAAGIVVTASNLAGTASTPPFHILINGGTARALSITTPPALAAGMTGSSYSATLQASGGTPPYTWSLPQGSTLPPGLTLNPSNGTITGVLTTGGTYSFSVGATDSSMPNIATTTKRVSLVVNPVSITTSSLPGGQVGSSYSAILTATGGTTPPYVWSVASGRLPAGLRLDRTSGTISGTPTAPGATTFTVKASDASRPPITSARALTLLIASRPAALVITTANPLTGASLTVPYSITLAVGGGSPPYRWAVTSGTLPGGLMLDGATGTISGSPTAAGTSTFSVTVTDSSAPSPMRAVATFSLSVTAPKVMPSVYVVNGNGSVSSYPLGVSGNVVPATLLAGSATGFGTNQADAVTLDPTGRTYVASYAYSSIDEFPYGTTGNTAPDMVISGAATGLAKPTALALDQAGRLYVANESPPSITVYEPGASGDATPVATLAGPHTGLNDPQALTFDQNGNLWVADIGTSTLTAFPPLSNGDTYPLQTIAGPDTGLNAPDGMTLDGAGNLLVANTATQSLTEYSTGASGDNAPLRTITGPNTQLDFPYGIDVDTTGDIFVSNLYGNSLAEFAPGATGDAPPISIISGPSTALIRPTHLAVAPPLSIRTTLLPVAHTGAPYQTSLRGDLGTTPYRWTILAGHLPTGVQLEANGAITGRPRTDGAFHFIVQVTDSTRPMMTASQALTLRVLAAERHPPGRLSTAR